jgi:hypothetical protein
MLEAFQSYQLLISLNKFFQSLSRTNCTRAVLSFHDFRQLHSFPFPSSRAHYEWSGIKILRNHFFGKKATKQFAFDRTILCNFENPMSNKIK